MCGPHIPLIMAGTEKIKPVNTDVTGNAVAYPALTFGKDINVLVSPEPEHCGFILDWVKRHNLQNKITFFFSESSDFNLSEFEYLKKRLDDTSDDYMNRLKAFAATFTFQVCPQ